MRLIIKRLSEKHSIAEEEIERLIKSTFKYVRFFLELPSLPMVMFRRFGTFKPSYKKILYKKSKLEEGECSEIDKERIERYEGILNRLEKEKIRLKEK